MSIDLVSLRVGPIETNCYIIWDKATGKAAIIDPGGDRNKIISAINKLKSIHNIDIEWILLTHGHFDHIFSAGDLATVYNCKIGMHAADIPIIEGTMSIAEIYYDMSEYVNVEPTDIFNDNEIIKLGDTEIKAIHTPGHSEGGLCFVTEDSIFCGDTIFNGAIGRTDFPGGSYESIIASIKNKLFAYADNYNLYPGHGRKTTVGYERKHNKYCM